MDIERKFEDLGVDAILGVKLMGLLGLDQNDFLDGVRFMRFKDIIDQFKHTPDVEYIINKITIGKNVDKLNHVWGYAELNKQKQQLNRDLEIEMNKARITPPDDLVTQAQFKNNMDEMSRKIYQIDDQIERYEH